MFFNSAYNFLPDISLPYFPRSKLVLLKITHISMSLHPLHCEWFLRHFTDDFTISSPSSSGISLFTWHFTDVVTILSTFSVKLNGPFAIRLMVLLLFFLSTVMLGYRLFYSHSKWIQSRTQMCWCWPLKEYASRLLLDDLLKKIHFMDFFSAIGVGCNGLRVSGLWISPKFHGYKAMKQFDRQIGDFAGRWDMGRTGLFPGWQKGDEAIVFYLFWLYC